MKLRTLFLMVVVGMLAFLIGCSDDDAVSGSEEEGGLKYPEKEINFVVPFKAGSSTDRVVRPIVPYIEKELGQSVVVLNKDGAAGLAGLSEYVRLDPDGYNIALTNWPTATVSQLDNDAYDTDDFVPIAGNSSDPFQLLVDKDSEWDDISDFVEAAKENPGKYRVSMTGPKSFHNVMAHVLMDELDIEFQIVDAPGGATEAANLLVNGSVDANLSNAFGGYSIRDSAKSLAIFSEQDVSELWPEAKPINEIMGTNIPELMAMRTFSVHKELKENDPEIYEYLKDVFEKAMTDSDYVSEKEESGEGQVVFWTSAEDAQEKIDDLNEVVERYKDFLLD